MKAYELSMHDKAKVVLLKLIEEQDSVKDCCRIKIK